MDDGLSRHDSYTKTIFPGTGIGTGDIKGQ